MNSVAHPACCNAKHPTQLSTAQKADRRAWRYIRFHAFQSEEKRDARQEFKNSRIQELQEFRSSGVQEFRSSGVQEFRGKYRWVRAKLASNTLLIAWKPMNHQSQPGLRQPHSSNS